jgi:hypothetical protein
MHREEEFYEDGVKRHCKIAMDARPGGPAAKREPSPEGLGLKSRR